MQQCVPGANHLESKPAEKKKGIVVDNKLNVSHQGAPMAKKIPLTL